MFKYSLSWMPQRYTFIKYLQKHHSFFYNFTFKYVPKIGSFFNFYHIIGVESVIWGNFCFECSEKITIFAALFKENKS